MAEGISMSGLNEQQAREFHKGFMTSFVIFLVIAIIAHFLVWQWRPWFPGVEGYAAVTDGLNMAVDAVRSKLA
jgi:light-harvesting complex 1 beta chain